MPFSLPRLLSKLQSVITIDTANNDLRIANAVVFPDGTRQTTAGVAVDSFARTTANGANGLAQGAYNQANVTIGVDVTQNTRIQSLETVNVNQNTSISIIQGVDVTQNTRLDGIEGTNLTQNTNITTANNAAWAAYGAGNTNATNITAVNQYAQSAYAQANVTIGVDATQNTRIQSIETINTNQNTTIGIIQSVDVTQNTRLDGIEGTNITQNTRLDAIEGINLVQNTNITSVNQYAAAAYAQANVTVGVDATQNTAISIIQSVDLTQNTNITTANNAAWAAYAAGNTNATNITAVNNFAQGAYNKANTSLQLTGPSQTVSSNVTIQGNLTVTGNVSYTGNVTSIQVTGNTGQFFGYAANGFNALYAGIPTGYFVEPQVTFQVSSNYNGYSGLNMQNINSGANSSSDLFITSDNGTINDGFLDLGFASSNYNYSGYSLIGKNDGYLFATGNTTTGGGNMIIGTGLSNDVIFATGGINTINEVMRITSANNVLIKSNTASSSNNTGALVVSGGLGVKGNVYASNIIFTGALTNGITFADGTRQTTAASGTGGGGSSSLASWNVVATNYTVGNNIQLLANTTGGSFTITLPASPVLANVVVIADGSAPNTGWSNNNVLVNPNGKTIEGIADTLALNISQSSVTLIYDGSTWQVISTTGPKGDTGATGPAGATGNTGPAGAGANATQRVYRFNASNNQTIFFGADAYTQTLSYNVNALGVYLNGVFLRPTEDYVANNGTTIYLTSGSLANDALDIVTFQSMSLTAAQNTITTYVYTASNNQTSFGGADIAGQILNYNPNNLFVTLNGLTLRNGTDYLQSNSSYIALTSGALANDELSIVAFGSFNVQGQNTQNTISTYYYTSTAGQTTFSGTDIYGNSLSYMQDGLIVVRNGSTLRNKIDYSATNGTSVSLANPSYANDEIAITAFGNFSVAANGYTQVQSNNLFLTKTDANNIFASTANTYTKAQANTAFASTGKAIAMAIVFGG